MLILKNHLWDFIYRILIPEWDLFKVVNDSIPFEERYNVSFENRIALLDALTSCER